MADEIEVTDVTSDAKERVAAALGRAFFDDPLLLYVEPDEGRRRSMAPWFFGRALAYAERYGTAHTFGDGEGGAIWLPPERPLTSNMGMIRAGMLAMPFRAGLGATRRFMAIADHMEHLHKEQPARHWYLMVLGIDPPRQGQGCGGALIAPTLERADADRLPCYLETMKERNVTFYRKHGFDVVVEDDLPNGGPHFWTMRREPIG